jgi:hypothetical protein
MDTATIIAELESERDRLNCAIAALCGNRIAFRKSSGKPDGRKRPHSAATRRKLSRATKKRWAEWRKKRSDCFTNALNEDFDVCLQIFLPTIAISWRHNIGDTLLVRASGTGGDGSQSPIRESIRAFGLIISKVPEPGSRLIQRFVS